MANIIVSKTVNQVEWSVDRTSFGRAMKAVKSIKAAHEKPAKALEAAQKRASQSEGKAALAAAKAQTAKLRQAEQLSKQQQKQAQIQAKMERDAIAHANKMTSLQARQLSQKEQAARQNARLAAISAKVQAAARSRAMIYNPNMGGQHYDPGLVSRQTEAMNRGHGAVAADIAATKRAMALEEKRQREKEASLKRQSTAYDTLRRASLTISHIEGASLADKMRAVQAIKEATRGYSEQRYTIAEMRHELAKATLETRRQARLNRQIVKDKAKAERAGRINAERLTRERSERGYGGLAATGVIAGGSLIGSMGVARVGQTLQGSLERSREAQQLRQYDISQLEFNAIHDVVQKRTGYDLTVDKYASMNKDYFEKAGELLNTGSFKTNKHGVTTFSGGGELADLVNAVLSKTNQRTAQKVIGELQKLDMGTFVTYVRQLGKQFGWTENSMRHFLEAIDDGSVLLSGLTGEGDEVIARMRQLSSEGWTLSDAQQANLDKLAALGAEYNRVQTSLADHFSASFVEGLGEYGQNTNNLSKGMASLIPITNELGNSFGEMAAAILKITPWFGSINPENKHEHINESGWYYDDSAVGWVVNKIKAAAATFTRASTIPGVQGLPSQSYGSGTAFNNPALTRGVAGFSQPQITFTPPEPFGSTGWRPDNSRFNLTGEATVKVEVEQTLNAGVLDGLIDTKINDNNVRQQNMILGIVD
ncbi:TPA: chemotaxis protein [Klebsiella pneumoniae]|nr:chemotaxis protein [Klebsiella pneumoniae]